VLAQRSDQDEEEINSCKVLAENLKVIGHSQDGMIILRWICKYMEGTVCDCVCVLCKNVHNW